MRNRLIDVLRGVSILVVLLFHFDMYYHLETSSLVRFFGAQHISRLNQERVLRGDNVLRHFWIPDDEHISPPVRPVGKDQSREILLISSWPHRAVPGTCPDDSGFSPL